MHAEKGRWHVPDGVYVDDNPDEYSRLLDTIALSCEHTFAMSELTVAPKGRTSYKHLLFVYFKTVIVSSAKVENSVNVPSSQRV